MHLGRDGELKEVAPKESGGKEKHFQPFDLAASGIQSGDYLVTEFFRLLLRVGIALCNVKDVAVAVVLKRQLFRHSLSPSNFITPHGSCAGNPNGFLGRAKKSGQGQSF
jgi:hypothetical protein